VHRASAYPRWCDPSVRRRRTPENPRCGPSVRFHHSPGSPRCGPACRGGRSAVLRRCGPFVRARRWSGKARCGHSGAVAACRRGNRNAGLLDVDVTVRADEGDVWELKYIGGGGAESYRRFGLAHPCFYYSHRLI
jgi:hypothetical protein